MSTHLQRSWLSPLVAVTFFGVSVTGILMLFHLKLPGMVSIHEWGGLLFVLAGICHLLLNWQAFRSYFKSKDAMVGLLIGTVALVFIAMTIPSTQHSNGQFRHGAGKNINYGGAYKR